MKKVKLCLMLFLVFAAVIALPGPGQAAEQPAAEIAVLVDGLKLDLDVAPVIQNDRLMIPFRKIAEDLNVNVDWDGSEQKITAGDGKNTVIMFVDNEYAWVNDMKTKLDAKPVVSGGRTLIPARFFSETFGCSVDWSAGTRTVIISSPAKSMQVTGFYALGDSKTSSWTDLFSTAYPAAGEGNTGMISELALGWYSLDEQGNLLTRSTTGWQRPDSWETVIDAARQYNMKTEMVVHITDGGGQLTRLLNNAGSVATAIIAIKKEAELYGGVNLDFEGLGWNDDAEQLAQTRAAFSSFVRLLAGELKKNNLQLTLTLHAPNSSYLGYDYADLGKTADYIIVMAYDYGSKPESVTKIKQAIEMATISVPAEKLLLGISVVGETPESIKTITGLAKRYNLGGIALWRLGLLNSGMWDALEESVIKAK
ncbi:MAG: stalk domain-containing protein [Syntrophomonas sp.]